MFKRNPRIVEAERAYYSAIAPWGEVHVDRAGGDISLIDYDSDLQYLRIDRGHTPARRLPILATNRRMTRKYDHQLRLELGDELADAAVAAYLDTEAYEGAGRSIAEEVDIAVENGEVVGLIIDHLEEGKLKDLVIAAGGLIVAVGTKRFRNKTHAVLGRNIALQSYEGRPVAERVSDAMGIIWVNQDSDSFKSLDIPKSARDIGDRAAKKAFAKVTKHGGLIAEVPAGTTMKIEYDKAGKPIKYVRPKSRGAVAGLIKMHKLLPVAIYQGRIKPGPMEVSDPTQELSRRQKIDKVGRALASLAQNNADLTGLPVEYEDLKSKGSLATAWPDGVATV